MTRSSKQNDGSYFFALKQGGEEIFMCRAAKLMNSNIGYEDYEMEDIYDFLITKGNYSFSKLCEFVDEARHADMDEALSFRQTVDRFSLRKGDRVDWFDGSDYIKCRVTAILSDGRVKVKGIQDYIQFTINSRNESEFVLA